MIWYTILCDNENVYEDEDKREINKVVKELKDNGFNGEIKILEEKI